MSVVGLCSSMKSNAFLVIVLLALPLPLASFGIPPSLLFSVVLGASAPQGTAEFRTRPASQRGCSRAPVAGSADWIARQVDQRDTGRDSRLTMQMRLFDRQGRARERTLGVSGLRGRAAPGIGCWCGSPIRTTSPAPASWCGNSPGGDDDRFLYLPALGPRPPHHRRRAAGELRRQRLHLRGHRRPRPRGLHAIRWSRRTRRWADAAGRHHPAWRLESKARDADALYPKVISTIRKDNFVVVARRHLQSARRAGQGLPRDEAGAGPGHLDGDGVHHGQRDRPHPDRARGHRGALQHRPRRARLLPPRARERGRCASDARVREQASMSLALARFLYRFRARHHLPDRRRRAGAGAAGPDHAHRQRHLGVVLEGRSGPARLRPAAPGVHRLADPDRRAGRPGRHQRRRPGRAAPHHGRRRARPLRGPRLQPGQRQHDPVRPAARTPASRCGR